jgi:glycosyltransferase involved in cell wall biosynthesis
MILLSSFVKDISIKRKGMKLSPVILFTYNRLSHTRRTIEALRQNILANETELIIFSDAGKSSSQAARVHEIRSFLKTIKGFKQVTIIERETNYGLANNIIDGVTNTLSQYDTVIVLEDDMVTSPYFLQYMNQALEYYKNDDRVVCIHGYVYPVNKHLPETFFLRGADCWGWATWKRGWEIFEADGQKLLDQLNKNNLTREFDYDHSYPFTKMLSDQIKGKNNSWAIRWQASAFLKGKLTLYPGRSLLHNIGNDGSGTHSEPETSFDVQVSTTPVILSEIPVSVNESCRSAYVEYFHSIQPGLLKKAIAKVKTIIKNAIT